MSSPVKALDLASRTLDLTRALIEWSNAKDGVVGVVCEISQWLGREKLGRLELSDCLSRAKDVAKANWTTEDFFNGILVTTEQPSSIMPLFTQPSNSLGRMVAADDHLCWLVSTVACLFQYHDETRVNDCVRNLLHCKYSEAKGEDVHPVSQLPSYDPSRAHFRRVLRKIINSVWSNIINCGHSTISLPERLLATCERGHNMNPYNLGMIMHKLGQARQRVIIRSNHLLRNLTHWLLLHFDGCLAIVVEGEVIHEQMLGDSGREIEIRVSAFCHNSDDCDKKDICEIYEDVAGQQNLFYSGRYQARSVNPERPVVRRALYQLAETVPTASNDSLGTMDRRRPEVHRQTMATLQRYIRCVAQKMMQWLLSLRVSPPDHFSNLGFAVSLNNEDGRPSSTCKIVDLLYCSPAILNMMWGDVPGTSMIYCGISGTRMNPTDDLLEPRVEQDRSFGELFDWFPILDNMRQEAKQHCQCLRCDENEPLPGCLCHSAMVDCLVLLAHGIAEGFGAKDTSGRRDKMSQAMGMMQILLDLVEYEGMLWENWFGLAAAVILGCDCPGVPTRTLADKGDGSLTTLAAVQYGNMAVVAHWIDLTRKQQIRGCLRLIGVEGRLGQRVPASDTKGHPSFVFKGIEEEYAEVWTEMTERVSTEVARQRVPETADAVRLDRSRVKSDTLLVQVDDGTYSLITRIISERHRRIIDPADALLRLAKGLALPSPSLNVHSDTPSSNRTRPAELFETDDLLGSWPKWDHFFRFRNPSTEVQYSESGEEENAESDNGADEEQAQGPEAVRITHAVDSDLKQNVALALSLNGDVWICNNAEPGIPPQFNSRPLYIINITGESQSKQAVYPVLAYEP